MRNRFLKYAEILFAFGLIMASCSEVKSSDLSSGQKQPDLSRPGFAKNLNAGLEIPDNEIPPLEEAALHGSGKSALKLAQFYRFIRHDWDKYSYWITISAEDGDPIGMHNLAYLLLYVKKGVVEKSDRKNEIRARFWLERSAEAGNDLSRSMLKDMGSKGL
jgi:TPR repeat protein